MLIKDSVELDTYKLEGNLQAVINVLVEQLERATYERLKKKFGG